MTKQKEYAIIHNNIWTEFFLKTDTLSFVLDTETFLRYLEPEIFISEVWLPKLIILSFGKGFTQQNISSIQNYQLIAL